MDAGRNPGAAGIAALALAFHRAPAQHPDLLHGRAPLPSGIATLLKLAGGSEPDPAAAALAPADALREAAHFFIEQVLLHHDSNHYRVLGLEPGAPSEQIKEHHRLLMRVFHPDRERHDDDWKDAFASRINLAYNSLRDPAARRRYDATLQAARPDAAPSRAHRPAALRPAPVPGGLPPWVLRHLPQWVLAGSALLALAVVGTVYVNNPRVPVARLAPAPAGEPVLVSVPAPNPVVEAAAVARPERRPAPQALHPQAGRPEQAPVRPEPPAVPQPVAAARPQPAATQPSVAPPAPAPAAPRPQAGPDATMERFMSAYERGDTQGFMALFDEAAIGRTGGKPQIRSEHESLFRATDLRNIAIERMTWARQDGWVHGEGRYRKTVMRKGEQRLRTESGIIRVDLVLRADQALIMGLDYQPGERS